MDRNLLKQLGNIDQIAGIRESRLMRGRGQGIEIAEVYNAAGLRFTIVPDRCMDIYDLSYKGINLAFHSQNGLTSPLAYTAMDGEFAEQWPAGLLVTCGLDNVGGAAYEGGNFPTHGRISHVPASNFGTKTYWDGDNYILRACGEVHMTRMYTRHLSIRRTIETDISSKVIKIDDVITNFDDQAEPYMMLYHTNFGYPLLTEKSIVKTSKCTQVPQNDISTDSSHMMAPVDGRGEELYFQTDLGNVAAGVIYNPELEIGGYIAWNTENLPNFLEWKNMKSHDYVLAIEPCNTCCLNRDEAVKQGKIAMLPAYESVTNHLEIGVLDGMTEINSFIKNL
ncbi:MAG: aldose 1-epimerase family protein [Eubacteriales bacterium]|nr:aldose 1-epimerase family protein [Eubacteriales bacterium]